MWLDWWSVLVQSHFILDCLKNFKTSYKMLEKLKSFPLSVLPSTSSSNFRVSCSLSSRPVHNGRRLSVGPLFVGGVMMIFLHSIFKFFWSVGVLVRFSLFYSLVDKTWIWRRRYLFWAPPINQSRASNKWLNKNSVC